MNYLEVGDSSLPLVVFVHGSPGSLSAFIEYCAAKVHRAFSGVRLLAGLVLLVVLVGMADTLGAGVAERTRELGAIRSMGVQRRHLQRMVFIEGLALGALGFVLAIAGGLALGTLWVKAI